MTIHAEFGSFITIGERSIAPLIHRPQSLTSTSRALQATPNAGHITLAVLSVPEHLKVIAPAARFTLVTQNVDGLSVQAFRKVCPLRKPELFEIHGHLFDTICTICGDRKQISIALSAQLWPARKNRLAMR